MSMDKYDERLEILIQKLKEKKEKEKLKKKKKKKKKTILKKEKIEKKPVKKKRKVGRPKKRGPKKKRIRRKIIKIIKPRPVFDFKIVSTLNGKQNGYVDTYRTYSDAYNKLIELQKDNEKVIFPRKFLNKESVTLLKDEYLILEKNRYGDKPDGVIRNEFGKLTKQVITNNDKWVIRDKINRNVEETFWVYGYDNKTDRKTFSWIFDNLIVGSIINTYDVIMVMVYKNKLIIKYDELPMKLVLCKNENDSIRMYNLIDTFIKSKKIKQVILIGSFSKISKSRKILENEIMELTGWNKLKIQRKTN